MATTPNNEVHAFRNSLSKTLSSERNAVLHDPSRSKTSRRLRRFNHKDETELGLQDTNDGDSMELEGSNKAASRPQGVCNLLSNLDELRLELRTRVHDANVKINRLMKKSCLEIEEIYQSNAEGEEVGSELRQGKRKKDQHGQESPKSSEKKLLEALKNLKKDVRNALLEVESEIGDRLRDSEASVKDGSIFEHLHSKQEEVADNNSRYEDDIGDLSEDRTLVDPPNPSRARDYRLISLKVDQASGALVAPVSDRLRATEELAEQSDESPTKDKGRGGKKSSNPESPLSIACNQRVNSSFTSEQATKEHEDLKLRCERPENEKEERTEELKGEKALHQELTSNLEQLKKRLKISTDDVKKAEQDRDSLQEEIAPLKSMIRDLRSLLNPAKPLNQINSKAQRQDLQQRTSQTMVELPYESLRVEILGLKSALIKAEDENEGLSRRIESLLKSDQKSSTVMDEEREGLRQRINHQVQTIRDLKEELSREKASAEEKEAQFDLERKEWKDFHDWWLTEKAEKDRLRKLKLKDREERRKERRKAKQKPGHGDHDPDEAMQDLPIQRTLHQISLGTVNIHHRSLVHQNQSQAAPTSTHDLHLASASSSAERDARSGEAESRSAVAATPTTIVNSANSPPPLDVPRPSLASANRKRKQGEEISERELKTVRRLQQRAEEQSRVISPSSSTSRHQAITPKKALVQDRAVFSPLQVDGSPSSRSRKRVRCNADQQQSDELVSAEAEDVKKELTRISRDNQKGNVARKAEAEGSVKDVVLTAKEVARAETNKNIEAVPNSSASSSDTIPGVKAVDVALQVQLPAAPEASFSCGPVEKESADISSSTAVKPMKRSRPMPPKTIASQKAAIPQHQVKRLRDDGWITPDRVKAQEANEKRLREKFELQRRTVGASASAFKSRTPRRIDSFGWLEDDQGSLNTRATAGTTKSTKKGKDVGKEETDWREQIRQKRAQELKELKENPYKYKGKGRYANQNKNAPSTNEMFEIDPANNLGGKHAFKAVIRDKATRKAMHGHDCPCCKQWYEDVGPPPPPMGHWLHPVAKAESSDGNSSSRRIRKGEEAPEPSVLIRDDQIMQEEAAIRARKQKISRHREFGPPALTPPDYWTVDFPTEERAAQLKQFAREERELERERLAAGLDSRFKRRET